MNSLFKISYGLFALVLPSTYFGYITATFLLFFCGLVVLSMAVFVEDLKKNNNG